MLTALPALLLFIGFPHFGLKPSRPASPADSLPPAWKSASRLALEDQFVLGALRPLRLRSPGLRLNLDPRSLRVTMDPDSGTVSTSTRLGEIPLGPGAARSLSAFSRETGRLTFERLWLETSTRNLNVKAQGSGRGASTTGLSFKLPSPLPARVQNLLGPGGPALNVSGSENIRLSGQSDWSNQQVGLLGQRRSLFPTLNMQQDLDIRLEGQLSDRIKVNLLQNSANQIPLANRIAINYRGDEDDLVQALDLGNTSLTLPGTQYVSYSGRNEGLFGVKAALRYGLLDFTILASKQEGKSERASYAGGASKQNQTLNDFDYVRGTYFFLYDPSTPTLDIEDASIVLYRDNADYTSNVSTVRGRALVDPTLGPGTAPDTAAVLGLFTQLTAGADKDYEILRDIYGPNFKVIRLRRQMVGDQRLAVTYRRRPAGSTGPYEQVGSTGLVDDLDGVPTIQMKLLRAPANRLVPDSTGVRFEIGPCPGAIQRDAGARAQELLPARRPAHRPRHHQAQRPPGLLRSAALLRTRCARDPLHRDAGPRQLRRVRGVGGARRPRQPGGRHGGDLEHARLRGLRERRPVPARPASLRAAARPGREGLRPRGQRPALAARLAHRIPRPPLQRRRPGAERLQSRHLRRLQPAPRPRARVTSSTWSSPRRWPRARSCWGAAICSRAPRSSRWAASSGCATRTTRSTTTSAASRSSASCPPGGQLSVNYSYAPLFQQAGRTLVGSAFRLEGREKSLGGAFMYESKGAQDLRPRLGEEPSRSLITDLNTEWTFHPDWMTRMVDRLPGIRTTAPSSFHVQAEMGMSLPQSQHPERSLHRRHGGGARRGLPGHDAGTLALGEPAAAQAGDGHGDTDHGPGREDELRDLRPPRHRTALVLAAQLRQGTRPQAQSHRRPGRAQPAPGAVPERAAPAARGDQRFHPAVGGRGLRARPGGPRSLPLPVHRAVGERLPRPACRGWVGPRARAPRPAPRGSGHDERGPDALAGPAAQRSAGQ